MKPAVLALVFVAFSCLPAWAFDHAVVLQYHHFGSDTPKATSVTMAQFQSHVDYLSRNGFAVWPLSRIVTQLKKGDPLPEKCVAITIDDAYVSIYDRAFPLLKEKGWPFTVFVSTEAVDKGYRGILSWDQMREMARSGAEYGGHSNAHLHLIRRRDGESEKAWEDRISQDITRSVTRIREEIGTAAPLFAYPYGEYDAKVKKIVTDMGLSGVGQQSGALWRKSDFGALPRFPMAAAYADMDSFTTKVNALPLPVISETPDDPVVDETQPVLRLTLQKGDYDPDSLQGFLSGLGPIHLTWEDQGKGVVEAVSDKPLPRGRSRYNFTAREKKGTRFFWFSHLWIRGRTPGE